MLRVNINDANATCHTRVLVGDFGAKLQCFSLFFLLVYAEGMVILYQEKLKRA